MQNTFLIKNMKIKRGSTFKHTKSFKFVPKAELERKKLL